MRKISILLIAFGIGTLVACGGAEVTVNEGDDHAEEEAKTDGEDNADEEKSDEAEEAEEGEGDAAEGGEAEEGGEAVPKVCCEMKSKKGPMIRMVEPAMCKQRKGTEVDKAKCKK